MNSYLKKNDPVIFDAGIERFRSNTVRKETNTLRDSQKDRLFNNYIENEPNFNATIENFDRIKSFKFYFVENNIKEVIKKAKKRFSPTKLKRKSNSKSRSPRKKSVFHKK